MDAAAKLTTCSQERVDRYGVAGGADRVQSVAGEHVSV